MCIVLSHLVESWNSIILTDAEEFIFFLCVCVNCLSETPIGSQSSRYPKNSYMYIVYIDMEVYRDRREYNLFGRPIEWLMLTWSSFR